MKSIFVKTLNSYNEKIIKIYYLAVATLMIWGGLQINSILKRYGVPNFHEQAQSMIMVMILWPLFYKDFNFKHHLSDATISLGMMFVSGTTLTCLVTLFYCLFIKYIPHDLFHNHIQVLSMPGIFTFSDLKFKHHPAILFYSQALLVAPLWEELFRGNAQKGLTLLVGENSSLVIVAAAFAYIHKGSVIVTLPGFLVLGYLVKHKYSWGERALIHSASNGLVMLNLLTLSFGGSELHGKFWIITSVSCQLILFALLASWLFPKFKNRIGGDNVDTSTAR